MSNFKSIGEFALAIRSAPFDKVVQRTIGTFASSSVASDGGYSVPIELVPEIFMQGQNSLLPFCQVIPVSSGEVEIPVDGTSPWESSGIIAEWDDEGDAASQRKPILSMATNKLRKLRVLVPVTEELVSDSQAFNAWLPDAMRRAVTWKVNDAIINGPGVARPLGIMKSNAAIEVVKETSQVAGTIVAMNLQSMLGRVMDPSSAVWIMNPTAYAQVVDFSTFDSGTGRLAGLPVIMTDACAALGSSGDIILANMKGYRVVSRGPAFAQSAHLWFDQGLHAFRLTVRIDGQPILATPTTPPNSGVTRSHFVTLAARA